MRTTPFLIAVASLVLLPLGCSNDFKAASGQRNSKQADARPQNKPIPGADDYFDPKDPLANTGTNGKPDGTEDKNKNGIPDGDEDRDGNGKPDGKEDKNNNGIPDGEEDRGPREAKTDGDDGKDPADKDDKTDKDKGGTKDLLGAEVGKEDIAFDDSSITGQVVSKASINFEDIAVASGKSDQDYNDGNLCFDEAKAVFKVDTEARKIRVIKDAKGIQARLFRGSCKKNTLRIRIKRANGDVDTIGPVDPGSQRNVSMDLRKGDELMVDLLLGGKDGNVYSSDGGPAEQVRVTAGFCQTEGRGC